MRLSRLLEKLEFAEEYYYEESELSRIRSISSYRLLHEAREELKIFYEQADLVARICVQYNLPSGSPAWMCQLIMSY